MVRLLSTIGALGLLLTPFAPAIVHAAESAEAIVPAATPPAEAAVGLDDGDRLICRSVRVTGSRFPERECKTKRQRAADREAAKNSMDKFHDRNRRNNVKPDAGKPYNRQN
jgi:hypothetical protein